MIWKHNARRPVPDSQVELSRGFRSKYLSASLDDDFGVDDYTGELLEKQADLIQYLQEQKMSLSKQILELKKHDGRGSMLESDVQHLLGNKEQEIRSLIAECLTMNVQRDNLASKLEALQRQFQHNIQLEEDLEAATEELESKREENTKLKVQLEIEKDSNAQAQILITRLNKELANIKRGYEDLLQK